MLSIKELVLEPGMKFTSLYVVLEADAGSLQHGSRGYMAMVATCLGLVAACHC